MDRAHLFFSRRPRFVLRPLAFFLACAIVPGLVTAQDDYYEEEEAYSEDEATGGRRISVPLPTAGEPGGAVEGGSIGYELALSGATWAETGSLYTFSGVVYEVSGIATMRATPGLEVEVTVRALTPDGTSTRTIETRTVRSAEGGHFDVSLTVPEFGLAGATMVFRVHRVGQPGRVFSFDVAALASRQLELLADRNRYEPGETVHAWARLSTVRTGAPVAGRPMTVSLSDMGGVELAHHEMTGRTSGTVSVDIPLPESATPGTYALTVSSDETVTPATRYIEVFQRTTERIVASIVFDQDLVLPGGELTGFVRVLSPSGSPVRGAAVELYPSSDFPTPILLTTGSDGRAPFTANAPTYLSGDVASVTAYARIVHGALGTITAYAGYTMARTAFLVSSTPEAGGLVPEIDTRLYLSVADPRGLPIRAGVTVEVRGLGLPGGRATATTDAHGVAEVTVRLPRGAAARMEGGACAYVTSTSFEVEVQTTPAITATICTPVSLTAEVLPRTRSIVVAPGANLEVDLVRVPGASGRPVMLEALYQGRAVASAWATGARGTIRLPADVSGVIEIRARAIAPADTRNEYDEEGATLVGTGARAAVLVRAADAFELTLAAGQPIYHVRESANVTLSTSSTPSSGGWATLVVRDEAQHGGESDYAMESVSAELRAAIRGTVAAGDERFLRAALAGGVAMEAEVDGAAPIVAEPWDVESYGYYGSSADGVLRDPIAMREELLRRTVTESMAALESLVVSLQSYDEESRDRILRRTGSRVEFHDDAMELAGYDSSITLGGLRLTPAHLHEADPTFSFDTVARRVARNRLVFLLLALSRLGNPDDEAALRASAGQPPDRWLSLLVQLGMVTNEQLVDPWGRAYTFRRVTGRSPLVVVSEAALEWELSSPGPDGVAGNGDDVRDPFARAVPEGSPYAVACGEDELMRMLSRIAPGNQVLAAMAQAYARLGLAAEEERRGGALTASISEASAYPMAPPAVAAMEASGYGFGSGVGYGYGRGAGGGMAARSSASADYGYYGDATAEAEERAPDVDHDGILDSSDRMEDDGRIGTMAAIIREDFPATLFFVGEVALDASGHTTVAVPLADAITTYRIEAISWTSSGWTTSARTSLRVEQEAEVDAPVPETAVVGDVMRLPVRVRNRGTSPLRIRFGITSEGEIGITLGDTSAVDVPPGEAVLTTVEARVTRAGTGAVVVNAMRDSDGAGLDAVRRPMVVVDDARLVRDGDEVLVEDGDAMHFDVPAEATERGDAEARLRVAAAVFGAPTEWGPSDPWWSAWALAMSGEPLTPYFVTALVGWADISSYGDERAYMGRDPLTMALVLGALWSDPSLTDDQARAILRFLSTAAGGVDPATPDPYGYGAYGYGYPTLAQPSAVLLALAPAFRSETRALVRTDLDAVGALLRDRTGSEGATASDPESWSRVAAALALAGTEAADTARADEMMRRVAERHLITVGSMAWVEPSAEDGSIEPRIAPTALFALARIGRGDAHGALPLLRAMADVARGAPRWRTQARALACAAASLLVTSRVHGEVTLTADGMPITLTDTSGTMLGVVPGLGRPGEHTLVNGLSNGAIALLDVEARYAMPWTVPPARTAPIDVEWIGETGPREARSALALVLHNRGTRVLVRPIVEIQLPAGAELDEPTREGLASVTAAPAALEGNVLRLELRPLAPGAALTLPIRVRWSLGGTFRGLGVAVFDEAAGGSGPPPAAVLPSRAVEIADTGPEPTPLDLDLPGPPEPVPPPIVPMPRPLSEVLR